MVDHWQYMKNISQCIFVIVHYAISPLQRGKLFQLWKYLWYFGNVDYENTIFTVFSNCDQFYFHNGNLSICKDIFHIGPLVRILHDHLPATFAEPLSLRPLSLIWIDFNPKFPTWIGNHMFSKVGDEITYPFWNFMVALLKFGNG